MAIRTAGGRSEDDKVPHVDLKPLYTVRFHYPDGWSVGLEGELGREEHHFYFAEGTCEGFLSGRFRAANHPRRRADATFQMNMQGFIETADGALVMADYQGYGRVFKQDARELRGSTWNIRQVVGAAWHVTSDERYTRLNDAVCLISGEVRAPAREGIEQRDVELMFQVSEAVWTPPPD